MRLVASAGAVALPPPATVVANMYAAFHNFSHGAPGSALTCNWEDGTYFDGIWQLFNVTEDPAVLSYIESWGTSHGWACGGSLNANDEACAHTYARTFTRTGNVSQLAMQYTFEKQIAQPTSEDWTWVDAIFMASPSYALFGAVLNNATYWDKMDAEFNYSANVIDGRGLWSPTYGLFYRDPSFFNSTSPNGMPVFWGRGNGWAFAALARTMEALGANASGRTDVYKKTYFAMAQTIAALPNKLSGVGVVTDGLWRSNLLDPQQYPYGETTSSALFTFALAWGINNGLLPASLYLPVVEAAWTGLSTISLQPTGFVGWCQPPGAAPGSASQFDTSSFCVGQFLLAAGEVWRLASAASRV